MATFTIDFLEGIEVEQKHHLNELNSLKMLFVGMRQLVTNLKRLEDNRTSLFPPNVRFMSYGNTDGSLEQDQLIACYSHWFAISACNYARLVGFLRGLANADFSREDLGNTSRYQVIKDAVNKYVSGVTELDDVRTWRNKVGAHFAITDPRKDDNLATLQLSVMHPVAFNLPRYEVGGLALTLKNSAGVFTSELPTWSITAAFERLIPRYWPDLRWEPAKDHSVNEHGQSESQELPPATVSAQAAAEARPSDPNDEGEIDSLLSLWRQWKPTEPPYLLDADAPVLRRFENRWAVMEWSEAQRAPDFCKPGDKRFHLGLLPQPFCGDITNASIYVLMLNPGIGYQDYFGECHVPPYRQALLRALQQQFAPGSIPFHFLDPQFAWHGGFGWWHGKLVRVIEELAKAYNTTFADARARLGRRLASIELVPYHSEGFDNAGGIARKLPSAKLAARYVEETVLPKVRAGKAILIVGRKARVWGITEEPGVIVYTAGEARGAHLGPRTRGGKAIIEHLADGE